MSRIGKLPISIPAGVTVNYDETSHVCTVKGPKGELSQWIDPSIKFNNADGQISFEIDENSPVNIKQKQAFHGLYRSLVNNMVVGVSAGYTKVLELVGVGYRVSNQGDIIEFALGYTPCASRGTTAASCRRRRRRRARTASRRRACSTTARRAPSSSIR